MTQTKGKKPACTLLLTILILSVATVNVSADPQPPKLFVDPPTYTAALLGEVFTIDINISNVQDFLAFEFKLGYNTTLLDVLFVSVHVFYAPLSWWKTEIHEPEGYVWLAANFTWTAEDNGTLAKITFNATYEWSASCTLDLYDTKLFNSSGELITHNIEDGNYKFVTLSNTVATDKTTYLPGENVEVYGNLTLDGLPYQELVALEVTDPISTIVLRTLEMGTTPPGNITIVDVVPCNSWGDPQDSFMLEEQAYFNVTIRNSDSEWKYVTITINAYDGDMVPLGVNMFYNASIAPGTWPGILIAPILIPDWAYIGNGTVYASAFTDLPKNGGVPYCPEKSAIFQITEGLGGGAGVPETQGSGNNSTSGNYSLTFKLAPNAMAGIYRVYASTLYQDRSVMDSTVFGVNVIGVPDHYLTIQEAIDAATPTNNTVIVFPATYNEHVIINKSLKLVGVDPTTTIIDGNGTGTVVTVTAGNVKISRFTIQNSGSLPNSGITLTSSSDGTISENIIISNNGYGIRTYSSNNNDILDNTLSNNNYGICLNQSSYLILKDNTLIGNKYNFGVFGDSISEFTHDIDDSNTVNGKPIIYWKDEQDREVPSNAGFVAIVGSLNITLRDLDMIKEGQGILLAFTTGSLIERVNTTNDEYGIYMVYSHDNTIVGSIMSNNTIGIYQNYCNGNIICHNNFINNTNPTELYQSSNTWNDNAGKGNYWSNYMGNDTNGDGVGDTLLPHQDVDWYPLIDPWILTHDIAIISVTPVIPYNVTDVFPGWVINVNVTVKNEGDFTETYFNITVYYDENLIEIKTKSMYPVINITITFTWDTTEVVSCRNYTISANATIVPGETATGDNMGVDGKIYVRLLGDVSGDGMVTGFDVLIATSLANFMQSVPPADPYADVSGDGMVTGFDVLLITSIENFMKACPP